MPYHVKNLYPPNLVEFAYSDSPLPIAASQTISQPYIVALMTAALELKPGDRVLEVGTGSGYAAAILAEIATQVYTIERHKILADSARGKLEELGYETSRFCMAMAAWAGQSMHHLMLLWLLRVDRKYPKP